MQYRARLMPYALACAALLALLTSCGARPAPTPQPTPQTPAEYRLRGAVDCVGTAEPDPLGRVKKVLDTELKGLRLKGTPGYEKMDFVGFGPPVNDYDKFVGYDVGLNRPLTPGEEASLKDALAKACPK